MARKQGAEPPEAAALPCRSVPWPQGVQQRPSAVELAAGWCRDRLKGRAGAEGLVSVAAVRAARLQQQEGARRELCAVRRLVRVVRRLLRHVAAAVRGQAFPAQVRGLERALLARLLRRALSDRLLVVVAPCLAA